MQQLTSKLTSLPLEFLLSMQQRYWSHHKSISASINFLICKFFLIDINFQQDKFNRSLSVVNSFVKTQLSHTGFNKIRVIEWINSLLFNIVSMNQDFEQQISHSLSCNSNSSGNKKLKQDDSILLIQNLQQSQKQCFRQLLNLSSILQIISEFELTKQNSKVSTTIQRAEHEVQFTLMSTIQYLCSKMEINPTYLDELCQKLEILGTCECGCKQAVTEINENIRTRVNNVLFGQEKEAGHQSIQEMLKKNYNGSMRSIASLIDANYYKQQAKRPIFSGSLHTGMELLCQIIRKLVQIPKNSLFSQQMLESNQLFQLFMSTLEFRHLNLYANWLKILLLHLTNQNKSMNSFVKSVSEFLYGLLVQHQDFVHLIRVIGKYLLDMGKYNKNIIVDLLKKLVLNRFLLNPQLFFDYSSVAVDQQFFSIELNKIRLLFYPKKAQNPELITSCQKLESIFYTIVFPADQKFNLKLMEDPNTKCVIYRLDQSLKGDYQSIYQDYLLKQHEENQSNRGHTLSNSSYSLSFSFVRSPKQSNTKAQKPRRYKQQLTAKKMASPILDIPSQNCSINTILHRINGSDHFQDKSPYDLGSPVSQKSKKTVLTEHTDVPVRIDFQTTMIEQLVERRRLLGAAIKNIDRRKHRKVDQRKRICAYLDKTHNDFEIWRRQVESLTNRVRIEIELL